jgi:hypothetical protein
MLDEKKLKAALKQLPPTSKQGPFSRCVGYQHLATMPTSRGRGRRPKPLWGLGSKQFGGRFTPKNSFETIYVAEDPVTALAEVSGVLLAGGSVVPLQSIPWVTVTVNGLVAVLKRAGEVRNECSGTHRGMALFASVGQRGSHTTTRTHVLRERTV